MSARSALVYSALRLLAFLVPLGILMLLPIFQDLYWLAAIFAAFIGLSLSLLFLRRPLNDVTSGWAARRAPRVPAGEAEDAAYEDATFTDEPEIDEPEIAGSADEGPEQESAVQHRRE